MAKKFTDKLKAKIGIGEKGAKNGPESAPKNEAAIEGAERAESGEAAQASEKKAPAAAPRGLFFRAPARPLRSRRFPPPQSPPRFSARSQGRFSRPSRRSRSSPLACQ